MIIRPTLTLVVLIACLKVANASDFVTFKGLSGEIGYQYRSVTTEQYSMQANSLNLSANTNGYIWQPWFVTIRAGGTISYDESSNSGNDRNNQLYAGNIDLNGLPLSRFPISIHLGRSDNFISSSPSSVAAVSSGSASLNQHQTTTDYSVIQKYMTKNGQTELSYRGSETFVDDQGSNTESYGLRQTYGRLHHAITFTANASEAESDNGTKSNTNSAIFVHRYSQSARLRISTEISATESDYSSLSLFAAEQYEAATTTTQFNSNLNYYSESRKFNSNANIRYIDIDQSGASNNVAFDFFSKTSHFSLNNNYRFNQYLSSSFGGDATITKSDSGTVEQASEKALLNASTPIYKILSHDYGVNGSAGVGYSQSNVAGSKSQNSASIGHSARKNIQLSRETALRYSMSQAYSYAKANDNPIASESVTYGANSGLSHSMGHSKIAATASYSSNSNLNDDDESQRLSLNLKFDKRLSARAGMDMMATYEDSSSRYSMISSRYSSSSLRANYTFRRAFDYSSLTFRSMASYSKSDSSSTNASVMFWQNNLAYSVGKLKASIEYQLQNREGETVQMLYLNAKRRL